MWLLAFLAGALAQLVLWMGPAQAQSVAPVSLAQSQAAMVRCDPDPLNGIPGATASVTIFVQDVADLYGLDVIMQFDPAYAQVVDADPATAGVQIQPLGGFLSPDFVLRRTADNATGVIRYLVTQLAPSQPVSGSGAVARIDLRGVQPGAIAVPFLQIELARPDGTIIPATTQVCTWQFSQPRLRYLPLMVIR